MCEYSTMTSFRQKRKPKFNYCMARWAGAQSTLEESGRRESWAIPHQAILESMRWKTVRLCQRFGCCAYRSRTQRVPGLSEESRALSRDGTNQEGAWLVCCFKKCTGARRRQDASMSCFGRGVAWSPMGFTNPWVTKTYTHPSLRSRRVTEHKDRRSMS